MTPLICEAVRLAPEPETALWFDVGMMEPIFDKRIPADVVMNLPFKRTGIAGVDSKNRKFSLWLTAGENSMTNEELQNKWAWWQESDERYNMCNSESEAHEEAQYHIDNECIQGDEAEYMIGRVCHPIDRLGIGWVARNIAETIEENICCWCDDETGAEEPSIELNADDKAELGNMVANFVRAKASVNWWTTDKKSETTHKYVAGSNEAKGETA